jgi:hypothetical protein
MKRIMTVVMVISVVTMACGGTSQTLTSPSQSATSGVTVEPNDGMKSYAIGGMVISVEKPSRSVSDARIDVIAGANAGRSTQSDNTGAFALMGLTPGTLTLQISKSGFQTWLRRDLVLDSDAKVAAELFPVPPANASGSATGRCNDGSWTWARTLPEACANAGGIAYGVCPGPLCKTGS